MRAPASESDGPLFSALQHPVRREILAYLQEHRTGSAADIAKVLCVPVGTLSYHVRRLATWGLIEEVARIPVRGALKRVYQTTRAFRDSIVAMLSQDVVALAAIAYPDIGPSAIALLDEQALGELSRDMQQLFARIDELRAQTSARAARSRSPLPTVATAVLFATGIASSVAKKDERGGQNA